jgi:hypothetical protein
LKPTIILAFVPYPRFWIAKSFHAARRQFCHIHDVVTVEAKAFDDWPVDALIGE